MEKPSEKPNLDKIDHIAVQVEDIGQAVSWYQNTFNCNVEYQDDTWAMLAFSNIKIALVISAQHPVHIGIVRPDASNFGKLKTHRDGTESCYVSDPSKNILEVLKPL
ncbi:MAG: VOC family protein [Cyanobacteria bacterium TGS_CYA1]|nr:VOC family protein [Cyanobacteria bacterium TGS_CYA1]